MYDLVVLGGGSGGLNVSAIAAAVGAKVALIEVNRLGGECTFSACVPSKTLLYAAELAHRIRSAEDYGIRTAPPTVDFAAVMGRVRSVIDSFAESDGPEHFRARGMDVIFGRPRFESPDTIIVDESKRITSKAFVVATGSKPAIPPITGLEEAGYLTNETFWSLTTLPDSLIVIGAGAVGVELAQAMSRFGSKVTLLQAAPRILPAEDPEASDRLQAFLEQEGIEIQTNAHVQEVTQRDGSKIVRFQNSTTGELTEIAAAEILVATGRKPTTEGLNLEGVGVEVDPQKGVVVNAYLRTTSPRIYALGDVIGHHQWTHAAEREATVVFQNALLKIPKKIDYRAMPWATYTDPELATVGQTHGFGPNQSVRVFQADYSDVDRARIEGHPQGFAKVAATPSGKILGATILGTNAAQVLQEIVFAMEHGLTLNHIVNTVHPYPTYGGLARALGLQFAATRLEGGLTRSVLQLIYGFRPKQGQNPAGAVTEPSRGNGINPNSVG